MWTVEFWKNTAERAIKTMAQALLSLWLVGNVFNVLDVDWGQSLGVAGGAAVASVLSSLIGGGLIGPPGSPSFTTDPHAW